MQTNADKSLECRQKYRQIGGVAPKVFQLLGLRYLKYRSIFKLICLFFCISLGIFLAACSSSESTTKYNYPTAQQQRVLELCALVFTDPYYQYISPSRRVKFKRFRTTSWGFWATFADGRTYKVPIPSGLAEGENYYCNYRPDPTVCASRNDWDERCEFDQSAHPSRFQ